MTTFLLVIACGGGSDDSGRRPLTDDSGAPTLDSGDSDSGDSDSDSDSTPPPTGEVITSTDVTASIAGSKWYASTVEISAAGDLDGDGYDDIVIGDGDSDCANAGSGCARLFSGTSLVGALGLTSDADWAVDADGFAEGVGGALTQAGDLDGDGSDDLAIGARSYWNNGYEALPGYVHVWYGATPFPEPATAASDASFATGEVLEPQLAGGGDVDGDGVDDLVVGVWDPTYPEDALAYVLGEHLAVLDTVGGGQHCGQAVAIPGDLSGDGYDDVAVACVGDGEVRIHEGAASFTTAGGTWSRIQSEVGEMKLGSRIAGVADTDGDGRDELSVTSTETDEGTWLGERAYLFGGEQLGGSIDSGDARVLFRSADGGAAYDKRLTLGGMGDLDGDGLGDWVIGAPAHGDSDGRVYIFLASGGFTSEVGSADANFVYMGDDTGRFGESVHIGADVDGDGVHELLVTGPDHAAWGRADVVKLPDYGGG